MKRSLFLAALVAAPIAASAQQTPPTNPDQTQPSQRAAQPAPAPTPTVAAPPKVELYGTLNVNGQWTRTHGGTSAQNVAPRLAVSVDSSNVGVRGGINVYDKYARAEYQCETTAAIDGITPSGLCNRNSKLGLSGVLGQAFYGNWDSPVKSLTYGTKADDPFGNTDVFDAASIIGSPGFGVKSSGFKAATGDTLASFNMRVQNSVSYWTPKYQGLQAKLMYGTNEFKNNAGTISPKLWSASVIYDKGPFTVAAGFEDHEDAFGLAYINGSGATGGAGPRPRAFGATADNGVTTHSEDRTWKVGAGWELPKFADGVLTVSGAFERLEYIQGGGAAGSVRSYDRYGWQVAAKHRVGPHELRARYSKANDGACELVGGAACSTAEYGAMMYALGYAYHFAPTTQLYLTWSDIRNRRNAQYTFATAGSSNVAPGNKTGPFPGTDPQALALGLRHAF